MQALSLTTALWFLLILFLVIGFVFVWAAPVVAIPFFLLAFVGFLIWRGTQRTRTSTVQGREKVPTTREATADRAYDSGLRDAPTADQDGDWEPEHQQSRS